MRRCTIKTLEKSKNIPLSKRIINKYSSADGILKLKRNIKYVKISSPIELNELDVSSLSQKDAKKLAVKIFNTYHKKCKFINNGNTIIVLLVYMKV